MNAMTVEEVIVMFKRMGLREPSVIFHVFGGWDEEGIEVHYDYVAPPRRPCTCCECYFTVGPPGCDGSECNNCGDC